MLHLLAVLSHVYVRVTSTNCPLASYTLRSFVGDGPLPSAGRFPATVAPVVPTGANDVPNGSLIPPMGPLVFTVPLVASQPCTSAPSAVVRFPFASNRNAPSRVYTCWPPSFTMKKPSP